ncbi:MAG TPA: tRNA 2-thiouridine(34) synthase MnmA [Actinomycetota bacterium]|nr:tRNA 2-thiouridine(34) synthase MnmA [Actinomycetota bacterium]
MSSRGSVLVAMSGGVDSSVAACLLLEQGYDVMGSHMQLVHLDGVEHGCCGPAARADASEVARVAGFPFEICDLSDEFERTVIAGFVAEHEAGRTPNPCARCNGEIKFGAFLRRADELGIDSVATGHYVRTDRMDGGIRLLRGADRAKDQSYMLHMLGQLELSRSLFPVGGMPKAETRALAERLGLPVANKPDSQELCFAPSGEAGAYLETVAPHLMREGEVVDTDGRVLASHPGTAAFTVGQRRGLGVAGPEPSYVLEIDAAANRVVVGPGELLARPGLLADRVTWIAGKPPSDGPFEAEVRLRYRGDDVPAVVEPLGDRVRVELRTPQRGIAPGQSAALYRGDELLGGGRIVDALR